MASTTLYNKKTYFFISALTALSTTKEIFNYDLILHRSNMVTLENRRKIAHIFFLLMFRIITLIAPKLFQLINFNACSRSSRNAFRIDFFASDIRNSDSITRPCTHDNALSDQDDLFPESFRKFGRSMFAIY